MSIATRGVVKGLSGKDLDYLDPKILLGNTYHLWLTPGMEIIQKAKGLHNFMNWQGPILTDSGGFQVFSLGKFRKITDEGVHFSEPDSGKKHFLTPEKSIEIQLKLGSDIIMAFDECPPWPSSKEDVLKAVQRTTKWAEICKKYFVDTMENVASTSPWRGKWKMSAQGGSALGGEKEKRNKQPLLFGIIQGGTFSDLRKKSAKELMKIGFDGYAIGGVAVGEPRQYLSKVLKMVLPLLPEDKPRYLMGLGYPEEIITAVNLGIDMFDCVIPSREGRHGRLFIRAKKYFWLGEKQKFNFKKEEIYKTINIKREDFKKDFSPVDCYCDCELCQKYSRAYLRHLFKIGDTLALRLSAVHNLRFYLEMMERMRKI